MLKIVKTPSPDGTTHFRKEKTVFFVVAFPNWHADVSYSTSKVIRLYDFALSTIGYFRPVDRHKDSLSDIDQFNGLN